MIFVGVDWAEAHHDVCVLDEGGDVLARKKIPDSLVGVNQLHAMVAEHLSEHNEPESVIVGIETERGLLVSALVSAGYKVFAVNPLAASRYRERHHVSGAKSDPGDAKVLADLVRTDRHNHRALALDSVLSDAIKLLARNHQNTIWECQRQVNTLRSALKDYYPGALEAFGNDLSGPDAVAILAIAPTPAKGRALTKARIETALRKAGRRRLLDERVTRIHEVLRREQLAQPALLEDAYGVTTEATVANIAQLNASIQKLEASLSTHFEQHPSAKVILSLPGMGTVLGARVLGEFGDDPSRYADAKSRKNYAGTSPITRASGKSRAVLARHSRNKRLASALDQWAFSSLLPSPGARNYYNELKSRDKHHRKAIRQLANRWVGILHGCLESDTPYDEAIAWSRHRQDVAACN
jgi:hypothetical protein